ncbi:MAG TPA: type I secretion system permease/ATPase [Candidatus Binataceae bacterium]|nr:type I secretion system permease/ATPase [Candidatus Binataceae bacterium]
MRQLSSKAKKDNLLSRGFRATRPAFLTAIFFSFFVNVLAFVGPLYMLQVYDRVLASRNYMTLLFLTLIAAFLLLVYAVLEKIRSAVLVRAGLLFDSKTRSELFESVLQGSLKQPGLAHHTVLRELDIIREFMTGSGLISFCDAPWAPIFVAACFIMHPWYGWIALSGAVLIFTFAVANELLTREQLKGATRSSNLAGAFAASTFKNVEVLHAMGMWRPMRERWLHRQNETLKLQAVASDRAGILLTATKFLRAFLQVAILGVGAYLSITRESTPGAMIAASILMGRALAPVEIIVSQWKAFLAARSAYDRITELLSIIPPFKQRMKLPAPTGHLTIQNAVVVPPGGQRAVLSGVSFDLPPGSALGIIGPSAAGKSSLARAIVGVWPTYAGDIRIDGAALLHWDNEQLGRHVGYLPQDVELFSGTIAENIARFQQVNEQKVIAAAQLAGVHTMIQNMPEGYNTEIGDGGQSLSGGQRQRIGLARALYNLPQLVILDEPNASLDADGEAALMATLQNLKAEKRTVILITHKTNILSMMDKILVLNQGQMQGFGDRDDMFAKLLAPRVVGSQGPSSPVAATR